MTEEDLGSYFWLNVFGMWISDVPGRTRGGCSYLENDISWQQKGMITVFSQVVLLHPELKVVFIN